jgi:hypothetical protein
MVIRRASDSTTTTIGFDGSGNISEADIETFCTGTSCTVVTWKDQSGNGNDATAAASGNEPTIYTGGVLVKENGKVALDFDGVNNVLNNSLPLTNYDDTSIFTTIQPSNTVAADKRVVAWGSSTNSYPIYSPVQTPNASAGTGTATFARQTSTQINSTESRSAGYGLVTFEANSSGVTTFKNGVNSFTKNFTWQSYTLDQFAIGALKKAASTVGHYDGTLQEVVIYPTNRSTDRTSIESNIGDYFTQNTPLLDTYSGAAAAYSLRLLDSTYTGSAIRVRRSSDNTEQDIGFNVFGELDTVSLLDFAGTGDAFVKTWYDQSGNSNDATQTATGSQPQIVSSGAVEVDANGKPAVKFDGSNDVLFTSNTSINVGSQRNDFAVTTLFQNTFWGVFNMDNLGGGRLEQNIRGNSTAHTIGFTTGGSAIVTQGATTLTLNQQYLFSAELDGTDLSIYVDGTVDGTLTQSSQKTGTSNLAIGTAGGTSNGRLQGYVQEVITYQTNQSDNRTNIETNIATFYGITL